MKIDIIYERESEVNNSELRQIIHAFTDEIAFFKNVHITEHFNRLAVKKITGWAYDLDGHCSCAGEYNTLKEAQDECRRLQATGRDLKDDDGNSFI